MPKDFFFGMDWYYNMVDNNYNRLFFSFFSEKENNLFQILAVQQIPIGLTPIWWKISYLVSTILWQFLLVIKQHKENQCKGRTCCSVKDNFMLFANKPDFRHQTRCPQTSQYHSYSVLTVSPQFGQYPSCMIFVSLNNFDECQYF